MLSFSLHLSLRTTIWRMVQCYHSTVMNCLMISTMSLNYAAAEEREEYEWGAGDDQTDSSALVVAWGQVTHEKMRLYSRAVHLECQIERWEEDFGPTMVEYARSEAQSIAEHEARSILHFVLMRALVT